MPLNVSVTKRELKNVKTGLDLSVTGYDAAPSAKQVKNYHVVVITKLPFFKLPEHSEQDVVHFMVRKDYNAFENFQREILLAFPELKLPNLPRKFHVFVNETDIEERMVSFDCLVKVISKHKDMCTSAPMLNFLGISILADKEYFKGRRKYLQKREEEAESTKKKKDQVYGDRLEEIDRGFFGTTTSPEPFSDDSQTRAEPFAADSIFEEQEKIRKSAKVSAVLKDEESDLFVLGKGKVEDTSMEDQSSLVKDLEDNSELLTVTDSLDDVLKIVEGGKAKPAVKKVVPMATDSKAKGLFDVEEDKGSGFAADMDTDDITKYIQLNATSTDDDDLDLF